MTNNPWTWTHLCTCEVNISKNNNNKKPKNKQTKKPNKVNPFGNYRRMKEYFLMIGLTNKKMFSLYWIHDFLGQQSHCLILNDLRRVWQTDIFPFFCSDHFFSFSPLTLCRGTGPKCEALFIFNQSIQIIAHLVFQQEPDVYRVPLKSHLNQQNRFFI